MVVKLKKIQGNDRMTEGMNRMGFEYKHKTVEALREMLNSRL